MENELNTIENHEDFLKQVNVLISYLHKIEDSKFGDAFANLRNALHPFEKRAREINHSSLRGLFELDKQLQVTSKLCVNESVIDINEKFIGSPSHLLVSKDVIDNNVAVENVHVDSSSCTEYVVDSVPDLKSSDLVKKSQLSENLEKSSLIQHSQLLSKVNNFNPVPLQELNPEERVNNSISTEPEDTTCFESDISKESNDIPPVNDDITLLSSLDNSLDVQTKSLSNLIDNQIDGNGKSFVVMDTRKDENDLSDEYRNCFKLQSNEGGHIVIIYNELQEREINISNDDNVIDNDQQIHLQTSLIEKTKYGRDNVILEDKTVVHNTNSTEENGVNNLPVLSSALSNRRCRKCRAEIADVARLDEHETNCNSNYDYCPDCKINFTSKIVYFKHMASHRKNTCPRCISSFRRRQLLIEHMKESHGIKLTPTMISCQHCPQKFVNKRSLYRHSQSHVEPHQYICPICGKCIDGEDDFKEHMRDHVQNAVLRCAICDAVFIRRQQYDCHMKGHAKHICSYCKTKTSFSSKMSLFKHYKASHPNLPPKIVLNKTYKCQQCPKTFCRPSLLRDHKMSHQTDSKYFECRLCKKRYALRSSLMKHHKKFHYQDRSAKAKGHRCQHCEFIGGTYGALSSHLKGVHNVVISHSCLLCSYKTPNRYLLKKHFNNRHSEKKYLCDICGSLFRSTYALKHHSQFFHSNKRSFNCEKCEKSFKSKSCLSRHSRTHSSEKPYKCDCGSSFKQVSHLKRHQNSVHNNHINRKLKKDSKIKRQKNDGDSRPIKENKEVLCSILMNDSPSVSESKNELSSFQLRPDNTAQMNEENVTASSGSSLFTVWNSQMIHVLPSSYQLSQEEVPSASLVNGELQTISIPSVAYVTASETPSKVSVLNSANSAHMCQGENCMIPDMNFATKSNVYDQGFHQLDCNALTSNTVIMNELPPTKNIVNLTNLQSSHYIPEQHSTFG